MKRLLEPKVDDGRRKLKRKNWRNGTRHGKRAVVYGVGFVGNNSEHPVRTTVSITRGKTKATFVFPPVITMVFTK